MTPKVTSKQGWSSKSFYAWEKNPKRILVDPDTNMTYLRIIITIRIFNLNLEAYFVYANIFSYPIFYIFNYIHT